ncbi:MAG TPA: hypothetical protein VG412_10010 [Acidimicrobiales bacterium]|jgi:hypothetical protein|nr:hypothetical protein [Acidimicrobiales bacterium]
MEANIDNPHGDHVDRMADPIVTRAATEKINAVIGLLGSAVLS